jgi:hypothetical protein
MNIINENNTIHALAGRPTERFTYKRVEVYVVDDIYETEFDSRGAMIEALFVAGSDAFGELPSGADILKVERVSVYGDSTFAVNVLQDEYLLVHYDWDAILDDNGYRIPQKMEVHWNLKTHYIGTLE